MNKFECLKQPFLIWLTGLSGAGKTTISKNISKILLKKSIINIVIDGDVVRGGLCTDLDFSLEGRTENIRRIGEMSKIISLSNVPVVASLISPFISDREIVRNIFPKKYFIEVYVECPIEVCEKRDPKGLYSRARNGKIPLFTGLTSPYEKPLNPELTLFTNIESIDESTDKIINFLIDNKYIECLS
jgi:adenylylsulfate kinase